VTESLDNRIMPSHSGPWLNFRIGPDTVHCVPSYGPEHRLEWRCWCHPLIELFEDGEMVLHNVAQ
jgi:hypothetical protein